MDRVYRIFGSELSPYSIKVRSYFRYKQIPHQWLIRDSTHRTEFQQYARLPLIPLVVTPEGKGLQDSTPIIEHFEEHHPEPSIHPPDSALRFLSALIEEYADEWGNKPMFHYRWLYEPDQDSAAERIARSFAPDLADAELAAAMQTVKQRMIGRLPFVGSSAATKDQIEASFKRQLAILDQHLSSRRYLFGARPTLGDFGLFSQLYECSTDPTPAAMMERSAPHVLTWTERMLNPRLEGRFETWAALRQTLMPLLKKEIGGVFLPWSVANAQALAAGETEFAVTIGGRPYSQQTQKYHAKSLAALRTRYAAVEDKSILDPVLREAGCLERLRESSKA